MRIVIAGQKAFGAAVLRSALSLGHEILAASCPARSSRGDGPDRLRASAAIHGVSLYYPGELTAANCPDCDLIVAAHSHDFIGQRLRSRARFGAVGYHPSLLPRHRGRDAVRWAIKMGEPVTGGTVYWLNEVMDGGPIALQDWCWIRPGDDARTLWRRSLFPMGVRLMEQVLSDVEHYFAAKQRQDEELATFEPACNPPRAFRPDLLQIPFTG